MTFKSRICLLLLVSSGSFMLAQETIGVKKTTFQIVNITIEGMACQEGCADTIATNLEKAEGVQSADVNYATGKAIVKYDGTLIQLEKIENIITGTKVKNYVYTIKKSTLKIKI